MGFMKLLAPRQEQQRFEGVYKEYYRTIVRRIAYLTGDVHIAEELAQEVFIKLYQSPPKHDNLAAWLNTLAARSAYNHIRDDKAHRLKESGYEAKIGVTSDSAEDFVVSKEEQQMVHEALANLSVRDRTCLLMKHSGYKYAEIADCLEIEVNAVGMILARAQEKFKKFYERRYEQGGNE